MHADRLFITNRAPQVEAGWIHIVPKGELENKSAGVVQVLDDTALDSILRNLETERVTQGTNWPGLYAGREHHIYNDNADSVALAWFKKFEKRADGIWANADGLTPTGRQAVANGEYKFTSFVADRKDTQSLGGNKIRIMRLDTVGFTNAANGKSMLSPITNRAASTSKVVESLSPREAGEEFTKVVNRTAKERGWTFQQAWNFCRLESQPLYNRMCEQPEITTTPHQRAAPQVDFQRIAGETLQQLAEEEKVANRCRFEQAWPVVTNRRSDLYQLMNRTSDAEWAALEAKVFEKVSSGESESVILWRGAGPCSDRFSNMAASIRRSNPEFSQKQIWNRIKELDPRTFWSFVAFQSQ